MKILTVGDVVSQPGLLTVSHVLRRVLPLSMEKMPAVWASHPSRRTAFLPPVRM